jgi:beta-galactosidase
MQRPDMRLVKGQLPYGAQYWFYPNTTRAEMRAEFEQMRAMGMNTARIFCPQCETSIGVYDYTQLDDLFAAALDAQISLCPTLTLDLPIWRAAAIGIDPALRIPVSYLLDDPAYRTELLHGIAPLVKRFASHPALWSWILWNEPSRSIFYPPPPPVWAGFRQWLMAHYDHDIQNLLAVWYPEGGKNMPADFAQIGPGQFLPSWTGLWEDLQAGVGYHALVPPAVMRAAGERLDLAWLGYPFMRDFTRYNIRALTASIQALGDMVRASDPSHPVQINPDGFLQNQAQVGRDLPALARTIDIFGASLHPGHHFSYLQSESEFPSALVYYAAAIQAANKQGFSMISELQAGPNTWSGNQNITPDSSDLSLWSLTALGSGLKGILYWLWKPRKNGWEAGEWGLLHQDGRPTPRSGGAAKIGQFLRENSTWLADLAPAQPRTAILQSPDSELLGFLESLRTPLPAHKYQALSTYGSFRALWNHHIPSALVTPAELPTLPKDIRCLIVPYTEVIDAQTARLILNFANSGGWVYAEAPFAMKDPSGLAYPSWPGCGLDQAFPRVLDIWPVRKAPLLATPFGSLHSELFVQPLASGEHDVLAELEDGYDVVVERAVGKGRILYVGTCLSLYIANHPHAQEEEAFLASFVQRAGGSPPWQLLNEAPEVAVHFLQSKQQDALFLLNFSNQESEVRLVLPRTYASLSSALGAGEFTLTRQALSIQLPPRYAEVIRLMR